MLFKLAKCSNVSLSLIYIIFKVLNYIFHLKLPPVFVPCQVKAEEIYL